MNEDQEKIYLITSNLARLNAALKVVQDVLPEYGLSDDEKYRITVPLYEAIDSVIDAMHRAMESK